MSDINPFIIILSLVYPVIYWTTIKIIIGIKYENLERQKQAYAIFITYLPSVLFPVGLLGMYLVTKLRRIKTNKISSYHYFDCIIVFLNVVVILTFSFVLLMFYQISRLPGDGGGKGG